MSLLPWYGFILQSFDERSVIIFVFRAKLPDFWLSSSSTQAQVLLASCQTYFCFHSQSLKEVLAISVFPKVICPIKGDCYEFRLNQATHKHFRNKTQKEMETPRLVSGSYTCTFILWQKNILRTVLRILGDLAQIELLFVYFPLLFSQLTVSSMLYREILVPCLKEHTSGAGNAMKNPWTYILIYIYIYTPDGASSEELNSLKHTLTNFWRVSICIFKKIIMNRPCLNN